MDLPQGIEVGDVFLFTWPPDSQSHYYYPLRPSIVQASWVAPLHTLMLTTQWAAAPEVDRLLSAAVKLPGSEFTLATARVSEVVLDIRDSRGVFRNLAKSSATSGYPPHRAIFQAELPGRRTGDAVTLRLTYEAVLQVRQSFEVSCELAGNLTAELAALQQEGTVGVFDCQDRLEEAVREERLAFRIDSTVGIPEEERQRMLGECRTKAFLGAARTMRDAARKGAAPGPESLLEYRQSFISRLTDSAEIKISCVRESDVPLA